MALLEAYIDFPEEDIPDSVFSDINTNIDKLKKQIESQLGDKKVGERIRSGFRVSIIGAPNVGKSTLLNALAGRDAAIVSEHAGTTRDIIELSMDIAGYPVFLCDTAGIRDADDEVEKLGIERSEASIEQSDVLLYVQDANHADDNAHEVFDGLPDIPTICVINKCDQHSGKKQLDSNIDGAESVCISAKLGDGLRELEASIAGVLEGLMPEDDVWITQARHRELLTQALNHLSVDGAQLPLELFCEETRLAAGCIGKITGEIVADELLGVIFSRFCIGK